MNANTMVPRVTVAMPFYNNEGTLAMAIDSILSQTYPYLELLLCDDGSTDESLAIAKSFDDPRIVLWSECQRKALSTRLNECLERSRGFYFLRMDADDVAYPERVEKQVRFLDEHPEVDLLSTFMMVFAAGGNIVGMMGGPTSHEQLTRWPLSGFRMWHPTWAGRVDWFRRHRYDPRAIFGQDQEFLYRVYQHSRFATIPEILLGYRQDGLNLRKMVRYRRIWWRHVGWHLRGLRALRQRLMLAGILAVKTAADCIGVWTGLRYRLLRHRARPVSSAESAKWNEVWAAVQESALVAGATDKHRG
jgi:glycosyltransferase involved in cell wall biosynthesis